MILLSSLLYLRLLRGSLPPTAWHSGPCVLWPQLNFQLSVFYTFSTLPCLAGKLLGILQSPIEALASPCHLSDQVGWALTFALVPLALFSDHCCSRHLAGL